MAAPRDQWRKPSELKPHPKNSRVHTDEQIAGLRKSLREFGVMRPVVVDEKNTILAGHGIWTAAMTEGLKRLPVSVRSGLSEKQKRAYLIADNAWSQRSDWNQELLAAEVAALEAVDFDLDALGLADDDLRKLLGQPGETDPDSAPPAPTVPISRLGDLWVLGHHRLLCGDSTKTEDVAALLGEAKPHLMVTDPPYGVEYDADWRNRAQRSNGRPYGGRAVGEVTNDNRADWREAWALFPGDVAYVWHGALHCAIVALSLDACAFELRAQIIWNKHRFVVSRGHYHYRHEPCFYAVRKGRPGHWSGDRSQTTVWDIDHAKSDTGHSTQKPVECMRRPIENNSKKGDAVYEPFSGSGTTIIATEIMGRRCLALEIAPAYVDVAVQRWQDFTGNEARLEATDQTFDAVAKQRNADRAPDHPPAGDRREPLRG